MAIGNFFHVPSHDIPKRLCECARARGVRRLLSFFCVCPPRTNRSKRRTLPFKRKKKKKSKHRSKLKNAHPLIAAARPIHITFAFIHRTLDGIRPFAHVVSLLKASLSANPTDTHRNWDADGGAMRPAPALAHRWPARPPTSCRR